MNDEPGSQAHYQKGFNEGYIIAKHLPELSNNLAKIESQEPRIDGFKEGRKQFLLEQTKDYRPSWMNPDRSKGIDTDLSKDKDDKAIDLDR